MILRKIIEKINESIDQKIQDCYKKQEEKRILAEKYRKKVTKTEIFLGTLGFTLSGILTILAVNEYYEEHEIIFGIIAVATLLTFISGGILAYIRESKDKEYYDDLYRKNPESKASKSFLILAVVFIVLIVISLYISLFNI